MIKIDVIVEDKGWNLFIKNPSIYIKKKTKKLKKIKLFNSSNLECTLLLSDSNRIKYLNKNFRNKNKNTDVLSFPSFEKKELKKEISNKKKIYIGDIIINIDKVSNNNKNTEVFLKNFNKLWIHGLIHLFGYKHKKNSDFDEMKKIEENIFKLIN